MHNINHSNIKTKIFFIYIVLSSNFMVANIIIIGDLYNFYF